MINYANRLVKFLIIRYNMGMYKMPTKRLWLLRIITVVVVFFSLLSSCYILLNVFYIRTPVNGSSMYPTLNLSAEKTGKNDIVYINRFDDVSVNDIVVLDLRTNPNFGGYAIKRLIALENDVVNIIWDGQQYNVVVNGKVLYSKPYQDGGYETYDNFRSNILNNDKYSSNIVLAEDNEVLGFKVPTNQVFVLGDNWNISKDSAIYGSFNKKTLVGKVDIVVQPKDIEVLQIIKKIF